MPRGRPPKPTQLKIVQGTARKCRTKNEPKAKLLTEIPDIPESLSGKAHTVAQQTWKRTAQKLEDLKLLSDADLVALESLCFAYERMVQAENALTDGRGLTFVTENGYEQQRPEITIASNARKEVRELLIQFGMTPASRSRVSVPNEGEGSSDPMEGLFGA